MTPRLLIYVCFTMTTISLFCQETYTDIFPNQPIRDTFDIDKDGIFDLTTRTEVFAREVWPQGFYQFTYYNYLIPNSGSGMSVAIDNNNHVNFFEYGEVVNTDSLNWSDSEVLLIKTSEYDTYEGHHMKQPYEFMLFKQVTDSIKFTLVKFGYKGSDTKYLHSFSTSREVSIIGSDFHNKIEDFFFTSKPYNTALSVEFLTPPNPSENYDFSLYLFPEDSSFNSTEINRYSILKNLHITPNEKTTISFTTDTIKDAYNTLVSSGNKYYFLIDVSDSNSEHKQFKTNAKSIYKTVTPDNLISTGANLKSNGSYSLSGRIQKVSNLTNSETYALFYKNGNPSISNISSYLLFPIDNDTFSFDITNIAYINGDSILPGDKVWIRLVTVPDSSLGIEFPAFSPQSLSTELITPFTHNLTGECSPKMCIQDEYSTFQFTLLDTHYFIPKRFQVSLVPYDSIFTVSNELLEGTSNSVVIEIKDSLHTVSQQIALDNLVDVFGDSLKLHKTYQVWAYFPPQHPRFDIPDISQVGIIDLDTNGEYGLSTQWKSNYNISFGSIDTCDDPQSSSTHVMQMNGEDVLRIEMINIGSPGNSLYTMEFFPMNGLEISSSGKYIKSYPESFAYSPSIPFSKGETRVHRYSGTAGTNPSTFDAPYNKFFFKYENKIGWMHFVNEGSRCLTIDTIATHPNWTPKTYHASTYCNQIVVPDKEEPQDSSVLSNLPYPIPTDKILHIPVNSGNTDIKVFSTFGKLISHNTAEVKAETIISLPTSDWPSGTYILIVTNKTSIITKKISVLH